MSLPWRLLLEQVGFGPRFPGCAGHREMHRWLDAQLDGCERHDHTFEERFFGELARCRTFVARFPGNRPGRLMLGTHYDTRPVADCDPDPAKRTQPVPGANDGASGTAVLLSLREWLENSPERPTVDLAFFDAEDWHEVDGKEVSLGARHYVESLQDDALPDGLLILDMIGGRGLRVQFDLSVHAHEPSLELSVAVHRLAHRLGLSAFTDEPELLWVQDDHLPFLERGVPSCLLIDMGYPEWHTVSDLPAACDPEVLDEMARLAREVIVKLALTRRGR